VEARKQASAPSRQRELNLEELSRKLRDPNGERCGFRGRLPDCLLGEVLGAVSRARGGPPHALVCRRWAALGPGSQLGVRVRGGEVDGSALAAELAQFARARHLSVEPKGLSSSASPNQDAGTALLHLSESLGDLRALEYLAGHPVGHQHGCGAAFPLPESDETHKACPRWHRRAGNGASGDS